MKKESRNILIIAATPFEIAPLTEWLQQHYSPGPGTAWRSADGHLQIRVELCGIGLVATSFNLGRLLSSHSFDCILQLGIAGAYPTGKLSLGDVVYVSTDRIADLGARDPEGNFLSLHHIGLAEPSAAVIPATPPAAAQHFLQTLPAAQSLSVNHISGDPARQDHFELDKDLPLIESMEGAAFHYACHTAGLPFIQIRSISNWVEPRDKSRWQMKTAIENLNKTAIALLHHL